MDAPAPAVVDDPADVDPAALLALYRSYDWWADRDAGAVARALDGTDAFAGLREGDRLVAAARVLTDGVYYARAYDVVVAPDRRGEGLGRRLLAAVVDHPALADAPGVSLSCREGLVEFYENCGFELTDGPVEHPDGSPEPLRRMVYRREERDSGE